MEENLQHSAFLGKGWSYPPEFSKPTKGVSMASGLEDIEQSLAILLSTRPGERIMQPDYGCNLDKLLFEPLNVSLVTYVEGLVKTAILYHEPRIIPEKVIISERVEEPGILDVIVDYSIRATNSRHNYVFPFYLNENMNPGGV